MDSASKAWAIVNEFIRSNGSHHDVIFGDMITMKVMDSLGGLLKFGEMTSRQYADYGDKFKHLYSDYAKHGSKNWPDVIEGTNNINRRAHGLPPLPPKLIGFKGYVRKAVDIMEELKQA